MKTNNEALDSSERPTISAGERALAMMEVQNAFSKHSYYHAASRHVDELADVWVKEDGAYAATASWTSNMGVIEGIVQIRKFYGDNLSQHLKNLLASTSKILPEIKNIPENLGVGFNYEMNFLTTPVIEIAGDGKTAKGIWYSPGLNTLGSITEEGKVNMSGEWRMTKYGIDFAKEDGKWKIWHIRIYLDNTPPGWSYDNGQALYEPAGAAGASSHKPILTKTSDTQHEAATASVEACTPVGGAASVGTEGHPSSATHGISLKPNPDPYKAWSPTRAQKIEPRFPEPYYTFSETFSY